MNLLPLQVPLRKPGLFITATDTGVGKTVVTSTIAWHLRQSGLRVAVCKPMATGCRRDREGLVSEDAEAIAHFSDCRQLLDVINPVRYTLPVAPAVAAEKAGEEIDFAAIARSLSVLDDWGDVQIVEGVGGLMVPISARNPQITVLDLAAAIGYPVLVVVRAGLGTLSHTMMTVTLLRQRGLRLAGLVINGYVVDPGSEPEDISMVTNRQWLEKMTGLPVLATLPRCAPQDVRPELGIISQEVLSAAGLVRWQDYLLPARP